MRSDSPGHVSPDAQRYVGNVDKVPVVYDVASGGVIAELDLAAGGRAPLPNWGIVPYFSANPDHVLVKVGPRTDVFEATGRYLYSIEAEGFVSMDPTGAKLAVSRESGDIEILDSTTLESLGRLVGHRATSFHSWGGDGRFFHSIGFDHTVRVWDLDTMTQVGRAVPSANGGGIMSSDGKSIFVFGEDGVEVWDFDVEHWFGQACELAGRNLTEAEWDAFGPRNVERRATCPEYPL